MAKQNQSGAASAPVNEPTEGQPTAVPWSLDSIPPQVTGFSRSWPAPVEKSDCDAILRDIAVAGFEQHRKYLQDTWGRAPCASDVRRVARSLESTPAFSCRVADLRRTWQIPSELGEAGARRRSELHALSSEEVKREIHGVLGPAQERLQHALCDEVSGLDHPLYVLDVRWLCHELRIPRCFEHWVGDFLFTGRSDERLLDEIERDVGFHLKVGVDDFGTPYVELRAPMRGRSSLSTYRAALAAVFRTLAARSPTATRPRVHDENEIRKIAVEFDLGRAPDAVLPAGAWDTACSAYYESETGKRIHPSLLRRAILPALEGQLRTRRTRRNAKMHSSRE